MSETINNSSGYELSWDAEINQESSGFQLIEEGDYRFKVAKVIRSRHNGSSKLPACGKAILTLDILDDKGNTLTSIQHNLFLFSSVEPLLSAFFIAVGLKKHGEPTRMNFSGAVGCFGWCHVTKEKWTKKDGTESISNSVKYFIDPDKAPKNSTAPALNTVQTSAPAQTTFTGWGKK